MAGLEPAASTLEILRSTINLHGRYTKTAKSINSFIIDIYDTVLFVNRGDSSSPPACSIMQNTKIYIYIYIGLWKEL